MCEKLNKGWQLYGSPTLIFDGNRVIAGQAIIKETAREYSNEIDLQSK